MEKDNFLLLSKVCPEIFQDVVYASTNNFTGKVVDGYDIQKQIVLTSEACSALKNVAKNLLDEHDLYLKVFDGYRPIRAVKNFVTWREEPEILEHRMKYYPTFAKPELFQLGFIAEQSSHSRGSTVDLTLVNKEGKELDLGTIFDFFGDISATDYNGKELSPDARGNRQILKLAMSEAGFKNLPNEWWHFTLINEPYPDQYFDFLVPSGESYKGPVF